jgi:hypothetical protein
MDDRWRLAGFVVGAGAVEAPAAVVLKFELLVLGDIDEAEELIGTNGVAIDRSPVRLLGLC